MHKPGRLVALLTTGSMIVSSIAATPAAAQRVEIGNAAAVVGDVRLSNAKIAKPRAIERKQRIAWEDLIDTGKKSQLQILLLDRSTFGIGASSSVRINRYVYDPQKGRSLLATLLKGTLRFFSGREEGDNSAEIETPAGRIGIRGTAVDMLVGEDAMTIAKAERSVGNVKSSKSEASLVVLRGPGQGTAGGLNVGRAEVESAGQTVVLDQPGLAAYIPRKGAPPIGPFAISNPGLSKLQDELAPEVIRARNGSSILATLIPAVIGAIAVESVLNSGGGGPAPPTGNGPKPTSTGNPGSNNSCPGAPGGGAVGCTKQKSP